MGKGARAAAWLAGGWYGWDSLATVVDGVRVGRGQSLALVEGLVSAVVLALVLALVLAAAVSDGDMTFGIESMLLPKRVTLVLALSGLCLSACSNASISGAAPVVGVREAVPAAAPVGSVAVDFPTQPGLSPDGKTLVFAWAGDLWCVSIHGGAAVRLTSHPGEDRRPVFSPDGRKLAFESDRDGGRNLFVADVSEMGNGRIQLGRVERVTYVDRPLTLSGWTPDGKELLFSANLDATAHRGTRMYRVAVGQAEVGKQAPIGRISEAFGGLPRMTADGQSILFHRRVMEVNRPKYEGSAASDVWRMDVKGGGFTRLTSGGKSDGEAYGLPDGRVVFLSSRSGTHNLWVLPAGASDDGSAAQVTTFDAKTHDPKGLTVAHGVRDLTVSADGKTAAFTVWDTLYTLDLAKAGAAPKAVAATATLDEPLQRIVKRDISKEVSEQAISPDGKTLAVVARGEIYVRGTDEGLPTRRVTTSAARDREIVWSPDGRVLWFTSDQDGSSEIYYATVTLAREDLAEKKEEARSEVKVEAKTEAEGGAGAGAGTGAGAKAEGSESGEKAADGGKAEGKADKKDEAKEGEREGGKRQIKKEAKKPDYAKRWAEAIRFEVKKLDTSKLLPGRDGGRFDGILGVELQQPTPSPDGTKLIFTRGLGDVVLMDLRSKECRVITEGWNEPAVQWAGDSRHIVMVREDEDFNSDIFLLDTQVDSSGKLAPAVNLTRHPDNDDSPSLSADGKVLYFRSERGREADETQVFAVFLDKKLEGLRPYELEEYFKKAGEAAKKRKPIEPVLFDEPEVKKEEVKKEEVKKEEGKKEEAKPEESADKPKDESKAAAAEGEKKDGEKGDGEKRPEKKAAANKPEVMKPEPMKFDAADAYLRIRRISNLPGSVGSVIATPAGDRVLFSTGGESEPQVVSVSHKGDDRKTVIAGLASGLSLNLTGDRVSYLRAGTVSASALAGGKVDSYPIDAITTIDIAEQQRQKFREVARVMGNRFYHPTLKGLDWKGLTERYISIVGKTRTGEEFDRVANALMGELDGSHTGVRSPVGGGAGGAIATGYLGVDVALDLQGHRVTRVLAQGPADRETSRLKVGDVITAVEGKSCAGEDLRAAMAGRAGKETVIDVLRAEGGKAATMIITPIGTAEDTDLRYRTATLDRRELVESLSGGKLGYLHIRGMSEPYVRDFERDLFAAGDGKLGVVIDVRDNGGGSTADILLSSLTAPAHAYTANRGVDPTKVKKDAYPRDRRLIYGYTRPISLLINENSFSNAEIFAHAIKTIGRGKLVGEATYGGVISTGQATLIDGTTVRTPFRGWYLPDGKDFENNGAKPDVVVQQLPGDEVMGKDPQLEAAVKELLMRADK